MIYMFSWQGTTQVGTALKNNCLKLVCVCVCAQAGEKAREKDLRGGVWGREEAIDLDVVPGGPPGAGCGEGEKETSRRNYSPNSPVMAENTSHAIVIS